MTSGNTTGYFTQLLTETDASKKLAVSIGALRRWRREGRGPAFTRLERCIRYDVRILEVWLTEHSSAPKQSPARDTQPAEEAEGRMESATFLKAVRK